MLLGVKPQYKTHVLDSTNSPLRPPGRQTRIGQSVSKGGGGAFDFGKSTSTALFFFFSFLRPKLPEVLSSVARGKRPFLLRPTTRIHACMRAYDMSVSSLPSVPLRLSSSSLDATEPGFIITQTVINMGPVDLSSDGGGFQDKQQQQQQAFMIISEARTGVSRVHQGSYKGDLEREQTSGLGRLRVRQPEDLVADHTIYTTRYSFFYSCPGVTPQPKRR